MYTNGRGPRVNVHIDYICQKVAKIQKVAHLPQLLPQVLMHLK